MKFLSKIFLAAALVMPVISCVHNDSESQRLSWYTEDPLTIPYRIRLQRYERPNLLRNESFETGRTFAIDSNKTSYVIDGWQQSGTGVDWVDISNDSLYNRDEVFTGSRSVKITRNKAYETDVHGEGITSEFVRVIPGNYNLSFHTRLENIQPNRARLGTRLYDAIQVQLMYYDKNKLLLSSRQYFPHIDQYIDISNKSLSFANFYEISDFGWGRIEGKSYSFPFPDGDIPSEAHYIKVYIGLLGTGTMWIDNVILRYSRSNFSATERLLPYTDTSYIMRPPVIPSPKDLRYLQSIVYYKEGNDKNTLPVILIPEDANGLIRNAAVILRDRIYETIMNADSSLAGKSEIIITTSLSSEQINNSSLILSIGNTGLYQKYRDIMPVSDITPHRQGYFVFSSNDFPNIVFLRGNSPTGHYYAALSAVQLFDDKRPVFHNARIIDYPDFENRQFLIADDGNIAHSSEYAGQLMRYKLNGAFINYNSADSGSQPLNTFSELRKNLDPTLFRIYGMVSTSPPWPSDNQLYNRDDLFTLITDKTELLLNSGADGIITAPSFSPPPDSSLCYRQPLPFENNLLSSENLKGLLSRLANELNVFYCPVYFNNELIDLKQTVDHTDIMTPGLPVLWSGSSWFGLQTDNADLERYMEYTLGIKPVLVDNSMMASTEWGLYNGSFPYYPGKLRLFNVFEPFRNSDIRYLYENLDHSHVFINLPSSGEINTIRLATAADFFWNMRNYDPDLSLWNVLVSRYGREAAGFIVDFAGKYAELLELQARIKSNEQVARNVKSGETKATEINALIGEIALLLGDTHALILEMKGLINNSGTFIDSFSTSQVAVIIDK